jgi:hypothetical protein
VNKNVAMHNKNPHVLAVAPGMRFLRLVGSDAIDML